MVIGNGYIKASCCYGCAALCSPASADTGSAFALGWLETLSDFFRLREVFGRGAPKEQAAAHFSDRQRYPECCGHAEEAVFHCGGTCPLRKREARRRVVERLNFFLEGVIKLDRKSTRLNSSHVVTSRMPSSA